MKKLKLIYSLEAGLTRRPSLFKRTGEIMTLLAAILIISLIIVKGNIYLYSSGINTGLLIAGNCLCAFFTLIAYAIYYAEIASDKRDKLETSREAQK